MKLYLDEGGVVLVHADVRAGLADLAADSIDCVVTSPPYWGLRDYGFDGQIGLEPTPTEYVETMTAVFAEVRRVLKPEGTLWLNMGDSYATATCRQPESYSRDWSNSLRCGTPAGLKTKDLVGIPWMLAFALRADGWYLRRDIIWSKPNPMPESVTDRPTSAHEYIFLMSKSERYYYDAEAIKTAPKGRGVPNSPQSIKSPHGQGFTRRAADKQRGHGRRHAGFNERWDSMTTEQQMVNGANARSVWTIPTQPFPGAHFATFPEELAKRCIKAGCPAGGTVLDPFAGSGTVGLVARRLGNRAHLIEGNADYCAIASKRLAQGVLDLREAAL